MAPFIGIGISPVMGGGGGGGIVYPQSNFAYRSLAAQLSGKGSGYDDKTFQTAIGCERAYVRVKPIITNILENSVTISNVAVAASANAWDGDHNPTGSWAQASYGGDADVTVAARRGENRPSRGIPDWVTLASIPRDDGGTRPLLYARGYWGSGQYPSMLGLGGSSFEADGLWTKPTDDTVNKGRMIEFGGATGNFVASNQSGYSNQAFWPGTFAEFIIDYGVPVMSTLGLGDSLMQGDTTTYTMESYGHYGCAAASTSERPIIWANQGYSSQGTANFLLRLQDMLDDGILPHAILYEAWSPNDPNDQAGFDAAAANLETFLSMVLPRKIIPILITPTPNDYFDAAVDNRRKTYRDAIKAKASDRILIFDLDAVVSDDATPARYKSGYNDGDKIHMNSAAHIDAAAALVPILEQAADMYFGS